MTRSNNNDDNKPFLRLETYGVHHGVAHCRIAIAMDNNDNRWHFWDLQHEIVEEWYLFNLECLLAFGPRVVIEGFDKLQEWRLSYLVENEPISTA